MSTLTDRILKLAEFDDEVFHCQIGDNRTNSEIANEHILPLIKSLADIIAMQSEALEHFAKCDKDVLAVKLAHVLWIDITKETVADTKARLKELGIE